VLSQQERIDKVVSRYLPRGWRLVEEKPDDCDGEANGATRTIRCRPIKTPYTLYVFLHEVGHVRNGHCGVNAKKPSWREEFEAEIYAIGMMRASRFTVTRYMLRHAKANVRDHIIDAEIEDPACEISDDAIRFVFGRRWRRYR